MNHQNEQQLSGSKGYTLVPDLLGEIEVQKDGILSRTLHNDDSVKVVGMALDTGQELSEHTASMPATVQFLSGRAQVTLGSDAHELRAGAWTFMVPHLPHSVRAEEPTVLLLVLLKQRKV